MLKVNDFYPNTTVDLKNKIAKNKAFQEKFGITKKEAKGAGLIGLSALAILGMSMVLKPSNNIKADLYNEHIRNESESTIHITPSEKDKLKMKYKELQVELKLLEKEYQDDKSQLTQINNVLKYQDNPEFAQVKPNLEYFVNEDSKRIQECKAQLEEMKRDYNKRYMGLNIED